MAAAVLWMDALPAAASALTASALAAAAAKGGATSAVLVLSKGIGGTAGARVEVTAALKYTCTEQQPNNGPSQARQPSTIVRQHEPSEISH